MSTHNISFHGDIKVLQMAQSQMGTHNICFHGEITKKISTKYTLWVLIRGTSNEYSQHMFMWKNKKNINILWLNKMYHKV